MVPKKKHRGGDGKFDRHQRDDRAAVRQPVQQVVERRQQQQAQEQDRLRLRRHLDERLHQRQRLARFEQRGSQTDAVDDHQYAQHDAEIAEVRQGARVGVLIYTHRLIM